LSGSSGLSGNFRTRSRRPRPQFNSEYLNIRAFQANIRSINPRTGNETRWVPADPLLAALDDALECPQVAHLSRGDRLARTLWWLIERTADEFGMPPEQAADEVAMLCGLAKEMMGNGRAQGFNTPCQ
jgi:hypothetical protein